MKQLVLSAVLIVSSAAWAGEFGKGGNTNISAAAKRSAGGSCDQQRLGAAAKAGAHGTVSHLKCKVAVNAALRSAGCNVQVGGPTTFNNLSSKGWRCGHSVGSAPDGAIMMYQRGSNRHYEIKYQGCYYSDFHHAECLPATQYHTGPFSLIGWCAP